MTDDYDDFRRSLRLLTEQKVAPFAADVDEHERFPAEAWKAVCAADLPGLAHPVDLGGSEGGLRAQVIAIEELSAGCASTAMVLLVNWAGTCTVLRHGSDELKQLVIPEVSSGVGAGWCLTEPTAGSDLSGIKTTAERHGTDWVLNGRKRFISNAGWGDWFAVLARSGVEDGQFGLFMIHRDDLGVTFGPKERKMGLRGSPTADVVLDDCRIPAVRAIGDPLGGYRYIIDELNGSRALIAAQALGLAKGALRAAVEYTAQREQFGVPISSFQMIRAIVADAAIRVESASALLTRAVDAIELGDPNARSLASMAKVLCSDSAMAVTTDAVQLFGGYGFMRDYPVERIMRDAKVTQIYEGSNQIQRLIISKELYKGGVNS